MDKVKVQHVAAHIMDKMGSQIESSKFQRLVYYCQAWSLVWDNVSLFDEHFEAWASGPVCPELYETYDGRLIIDAKDFSEYFVNILNSKQIETIDSVIDHYAHRPSAWLSSLSRLERPWVFARIGIPNGDRSTNIITNELMRDYYSNIKNKEA